MNASKSCVAALLVAVTIVGCTKVKEATLEKGIELFLKNKLEEAAPVLEASVTMLPDDADAHAWLSECLRRLGRFHEAADAGYRALQIDETHAFAHTVLGDLFNPHLSTWERTDAESTWFHLREAVKYDSTDGNAWSSLWIQAMKRGEGELERTAVVKMIDTGFLSKPLLAYNKWQLQYLPQNAILLTNGDMDTYPAVALQEKEGLRRDVAVVNLSLLNLPWYVRAIADRYDLPLPVEVDELQSLTPFRDKDGQVVLVSKQIVQGWMRMQQDGSLARPLCAAVTVAELDFTPDVRDRLILCGAYYEITPRPVETEADMERLEASLESIDPADFEGSFTTPIDRSPVRRSSTDRLAANVTAAMLKCVDMLAEDERWQDAADALTKAEEFDSRIAARGC